MAATCGESAVFETTSGGPRIRSRSARGFTIVELLVVIAIISGLMLLISPAVWRAFQSAKQKAIIVEIDQLASALNAYKEKNVQYPPSMAEWDTTVAAASAPNTRKVHFMRHVQVAFSNSNYGTTAANFDTLRAGLRTANSTSTSQIYQYANAAGTPTPIDLNTLDQAEALVFWLGGMPTPCTSSGTPVAPTKVFGFNRDRDSPFRRDAAVQEQSDAMRFRTEPYFDFKQDRLVDNDDDGWLEYISVPPTQGVRIAPFVYFDAATYTTSTTAVNTAFNISNMAGYPRVQDSNSTTNVTAAALASEWGMAVPMAEVFDATNKSPMRWKLPNTFQIIAPGNDGKYAGAVTTDLVTAMRLPIFPSGETYTKASGYQSKTSYTNEELDNLTNLSTSSLDETRQQTRQ